MCMLCQCTLIKQSWFFDKILIQHCNTVDPIHLNVFILSGVDLKRAKEVLLPNSTHPKKI